MYWRSKQNAKLLEAAKAGSQRQRNYENPSYSGPQGQAPANLQTGPPDWADPNVPFLSRNEAEARLKDRGMINGDYVVRQTKSVPQGYVVTSVNDNIFANSQLKFVNGMLNYGPQAIGGNLEEAISTLQSSVQISTAKGDPYFLKKSSDSVGYLDVTGTHGGEEFEADA